MSEIQQTGVAAIWCRIPSGTFNGRDRDSGKRYVRLTCGGIVIFEAGVYRRQPAHLTPTTHLLFNRPLTGKRADQAESAILRK
jgi:hypothetical protein